MKSDIETQVSERRTFGGSVGDADTDDGVDAGLVCVRHLNPPVRLIRDPVSNVSIAKTSH